MANLDNMFESVRGWCTWLWRETLYGDVEGDPELEAELLALKAENEQEMRSAQPLPSPEKVKVPIRRPPIPQEEEMPQAESSDEDEPEDPKPSPSPLVVKLPPAVAPKPVVAVKPVVQSELKPPGTLLEALEQRMAKYKETGARAAKEGDQRRARMMTRIQNQYATAIRAHKAGKVVDLGELPTLPGGPLWPGVAQTPEEKEWNQTLELSLSLSNYLKQQLEFLTTRQMQFKKAALTAKQNGDLVTAKKLLKQSKGFDPLLKSLLRPDDRDSRSSLPVSTSGHQQDTDIQIKSKK